MKRANLVLMLLRSFPFPSSTPQSLAGFCGGYFRSRIFSALSEESWQDGESGETGINIVCSCASDGSFGSVCVRKAE